MEEIYINIDGYDGRYMISNKGGVKSIKNSGTHVVMRQHINNGYLCVNLVKKGDRKKAPVHRLVASAFVDNNFKKPQVNHIDGIKTNNIYTNLEWVTVRENSAHYHSNNPKSSKYIGVSKNGNRWVASIVEKGKHIYLGIYKEQIEASIAYKRRLNKILQTKED